MSRPPATSERGAALVVVLWLLVVLGALSAALVSGTRYDARTAFNERCRAQGRFAARAGIADASERLRRRLQVPIATAATPRAPVILPGGVLLRLSDGVGDARYRVEAVDVSSRLNVNRATEAMLATLLQASQLPQDQATRLAQAIADWVDGDDLVRAGGAEADDYRRLGLEARPRNAPVPGLDELLQVRGMTPAILYGDDPAARVTGRRRRSGIAQWLTTQGSGRINLNTAPPEVLATLPGFTPTVVAVVLARRQQRPIQSISELAGDPRVAGAALERYARELTEITLGGSASEGAEVRALGAVPGCAAGGRVDAVLAMLPGQVIVASWVEGWARADEVAVDEDAEAAS